jgi:hypothetical protein
MPKTLERDDYTADDEAAQRLMELYAMLSNGDDTRAVDHLLGTYVGLFMAEMYPKVARGVIGALMNTEPAMPEDIKTAVEGYVTAVCKGKMSAAMRDLYEKRIREQNGVPA